MFWGNELLRVYKQNYDVFKRPWPKRQPHGFGMECYENYFEIIIILIHISCAKDQKFPGRKVGEPP